jgi:hypothetical protein
MRIQIARIASGLLQQRGDELLRDVSLPLSVRGMIGVHLTSPWIPDFWSVAIRAVKPDSEGYFDFPIGYAEDGTSWFFPSRQWWLAHAQASHPPAGASCDAEAHTTFLSSEGSVHEFDYAAVLAGGQLSVLGRADFVLECALWTRAFGAQPATAP